MKDLIDSLDSEKEQKKNASLKIKGGLDALINGWKYVNSFHSSFHYSFFSTREFYSLCEQIIPGDYNNLDIQNMCFLLPNYASIKFFEHKSGLFISVLINFCAETDFFLNTEQINMDFFGYMNCKNVTVNGNLGHNVGCQMVSGKIIVHGNAGNELGLGMSDGIITVNGNSGENIGLMMNGGRIELNGNYKSISGRKYKNNNEIYQNGKKLV